jgi:hypothetical protein
LPAVTIEMRDATAQTLDIDGLVSKCRKRRGQTNVVNAPVLKAKIIYQHSAPSTASHSKYEEVTHRFVNYSVTSLEPRPSSMKHETKDACNEDVAGYCECVYGY